MYRYILIFMVAVMTWGGKLLAQEPLRPVSSAYMLEGGSSHLLDTYLSPLKYTGWHTAFTYERRQAMKFSPEKWRQQLDLGVEINSAGNPARNASLLYGNLSAAWSMSRLWRLPYRLRVTAGGRAEGNLGGIYSNRNGNNPAALKTDISLGLTASLGWDVRVWRLPVALRWQTSMPLAGVFFSPQYDELYYEIYLGNSHGLAHFGWPGSMFRWDNLVTADLGLGNTSLRLGFRSRIYSTEVNHVTTRTFSYSFVLGVVTDWLSVSPRRQLPDKDAKVEWAY
ncbi:MAG: DUF3316 domain-containing protein [Muribaculaceae bacterium]|nr:DUF3316 domain-containing protein [Muribaculaceae bacterium]